MRIRFLAADSFGVRSMAHVVETADIRLGIDLWASFAPRRYGLPPHELELLALERARELLAEWGRKVDVHVITHYHFDHFCPDCPFYKGKPIWGKSPENFINRSQRGRFGRFLFRDTVEFADGKSFRMGETLVEFSRPVFHGEKDTPLGWVIMVFVEENRGFLYTSDVEGLIDDETWQWIREREPDVVYMDGPLYIKRNTLDEAWKNIERMADIADVVVVDHHGARSTEFFEKIDEMGLSTAARQEFGSDLPLEAWRKELWKGREVDREEVESRYKRWSDY